MCSEFPRRVQFFSIDPTPAAILSASDLHMNQGTVTMPGANQSAEGTDQGGLGTGKHQIPCNMASGDSGSTGTERAQEKDKARVVEVRRCRQRRSHKRRRKRHGGKWLRRQAPARWKGTGHNPGSAIRTIEWARLGRRRQWLPSPASACRRTASSESLWSDRLLTSSTPKPQEVWKGRLAYSVYLHVGLEKSWILQYSLPRAADSATAGSARLAAAVAVLYRSPESESR